MNQEELMKKRFILPTYFMGGSGSGSKTHLLRMKPLKENKVKIILDVEEVDGDCRDCDLDQVCDATDNDFPCVSKMDKCWKVFSAEEVK